MAVQEDRAASDSAAQNNIPSIEAIRAECQKVFGVRACRLQALFAQAILRGSDVLFEVGTGVGKTLAFWLPVLLRPTGIQVVVTALNVLGDQNVTQLARAGIKAITINAESATAANFKVNFQSIYN